MVGISSSTLKCTTTNNLTNQGDVVYTHVLGQGLVFLNSLEAASDLLDKRGSIYSDKPQLVMLGELCVTFDAFWHGC